MFTKLESDAFTPLTDIMETDLDTIESNIVAAEEALVDHQLGNRPASSRLYLPHSHPATGGVNIAHGLVGGFDLGRQYHILSKYWSDLCTYGKGWSDTESSRKLLVLVKYHSSVNGAIRFPEGEKIDFKAGEIGWGDVVITVRGSSRYGSRVLSVGGEFPQHDPTTDWVRIHAVQIYETSEDTVVSLPHYSPVSGVCEKPYTAPVSLALYSAGDWISADRIKRWGQNLQAVYECLYDEKGTGMSTQTIQGHDHDTLGGPPVPMNYIGGVAASPKVIGSTSQTPIFSTTDIAPAGTWFYADQSTTLALKRTAGTPGGTPTCCPHFMAYSPAGWGATPHKGYAVVSAEITSGGLPPVITTRLYNITTTSHSSAETLVRDNTVGGYLVGVITDVPLVSGWNELAIEYSLSDTGFTVNTKECMVFEVPFHNGMTISLKSTAGVMEL